MFQGKFYDFRLEPPLKNPPQVGLVFLTTPLAWLEQRVMKTVRHGNQGLAFRRLPRQHLTVANFSQYRIES